MPTLDEKRTVLQKAKELRESDNQVYNKVYIRPDMTKKQQEVSKNLERSTKPKEGSVSRDKMDHKEGQNCQFNSIQVNQTIQHKITLNKAANNPEFKSKTNPSKIKILNINCQNAKAKKQYLHHLIHAEKPEIINGTESWLKSSDSNDECAPTALYEVSRRDRCNKIGGGVFIAVRRDLTSEEQPQLCTSCEILLCKITLAN